jgi:hypothetical protein
MSTNTRSVKITNETLFGFHDKILDLSLPQPGFHFSGSCSSLGEDRGRDQNRVPPPNWNH